MTEYPQNDNKALSKNKSRFKNNFNTAVLIEIMF